MKLMIDIPDKMYEEVKSGIWFENNIISNAIDKGTPLSESEDCVSRQAVLDAIDVDRKKFSSHFVSNHDAQCFKDIIKEIPPVTSKLCTDAISRQAVGEVLLKYAHSTEGKAFAEFLVSQINDLPPVIPAEKVGQWIKKEHEICFTCNRCWVTNASGTKYNYCPNCGAKMQEVEE